jgi:hypothetical protein
MAWRETGETDFQVQMAAIQTLGFIGGAIAR